MYEVIISDQMILAAQLMAKKLGSLNNSITDGAGNISGFLGEIICWLEMGGSLENSKSGGSPSYDFDLILADGTTVDVKTKRTTVEPQTHYDCSVAAFNTKQKCDVYAFVRVTNDLKRGWFLGYLPKDEYFSKSVFLQKGQVDPDNNFIVKADCYNVKIKNLKTIDVPKRKKIDQ